MMSRTRGAKSGLRLLTIFVIGLMAICVEGSANTTKDNMKEGARYEKDGQFYRAAEAYARILRLTPGDQKARAALARVGDRAMDEKLAAVSVLETEMKLDDAIAALDAAGRLRVQMLSLKIELDRPGAVDSRRVELVTLRVRTLLAEADRAQADGLWSVAVAHLQQVDALAPDFEDTRKRLYNVWVSWGEANLREGRLRAAAERFEHAARVPTAGSTDAAKRAVAIRVGLGLSALERGACRSAIADLRSADRLAPGSVQQGDIQRASACARTCVQLKVVAETDSGLGETRLEELRTDLRGQVGAAASEFLVVQGSNAGRAPNCDQRTVPGVDGRPMKTGPYVAVVKVTASRIIRQPASSVTRQAQTQHGGMSATYYTYEEYREVLTGTLSGWVTVADQGSGNLNMALPVQITGEAVVGWRRAPLSSATYQDLYTGRQSTVVMIDATDRGKAQVEAERSRTRADLTETLVADFATEAARLLVSAVDVEPAVPDPATLPEEH